MIGLSTESSTRALRGYYLLEVTRDKKSLRDFYLKKKWKERKIRKKIVVLYKNKDCWCVYCEEGLRGKSFTRWKWHGGVRKVMQELRHYCEVCGDDALLRLFFFLKIFCVGSNNRWRQSVLCGREHAV